MKIALLIDQITPGSALKLLSYPFHTICDDGNELEALVIKRTETPLSQLELLKSIPIEKIHYLHDYYPKYLSFFDKKIPGLTFFGFYHLYSYFFAGYALKKIKKKYDVVIAYCQYTSFAAKSIKRVTGGNYLVLAWDPSVHTLNKIYAKKFGIYLPLLRFIANIYDRICFYGSSGIINSCFYHGDSFRKLTNSKINILPPGCNPVLNPFDTNRHRDLISWDRWDYGNDPKKLLQILSNLKNSNIKLTIGGYWNTKELFDEFISKATELSLMHRIELLPELSELEIANLCLTGKLHIHPIHEAFGMQVLEASAAGCPSVIVRGSGAAELYEHRVSGLHPEDSIDAFVEEISWAFESSTRLIDLSRGAYKIANKYTWKEHSRKILEICFAIK